MVLAKPDKFLSHIQQPDRVACLTSAQAAAVVAALDVLSLEEPTSVANNLAAKDLPRGREQLEVRLRL